MTLDDWVDPKIELAAKPAGSSLIGYGLFLLAPENF